MELLVCLFLILFLLTTCSSSGTHDEHFVLLHHDKIDTRVRLQFHEEPHPLRHFTHLSAAQRIKSDTSKHHFILQLAEQTLQRTKHEIVNQKLYINLTHYLPHNAYMIYATHQTADKLRKLQGVKWIGNVHPKHKLAPNIFDTKTENHLMQLKVILAENFELNDLERKLTTWLAKDSSPGRKVHELLKHKKFEIVHGSRVVVETTESEDLKVQYIQRDLKMKMHNLYARALVQLGSNTPQGLNANQMPVNPNSPLLSTR
jgi:hypothetical protein